MKTIHTNTKNKSIIKKIYKDVLNKDKEFHFFYEPELVIRTSLVKNVRKWLDKNKIMYRTYDYPVPKNTEGEYCYECNDFTRDNIEFFKKVYHINSVAALEFNKSKWNKFIERLMHTAYNAKGFNHHEEGEDLFLHAIRRILTPVDIVVRNNRSLIKKVVKLITE